MPHDYRTSVLATDGESTQLAGEATQPTPPELNTRGQSMADPHRKSGTSGTKPFDYAFLPSIRRSRSYETPLAHGPGQRLPHGAGSTLEALIAYSNTQDPPTNMRSTPLHRHLAAYAPQNTSLATLAQLFPWMQQERLPQHTAIMCGAMVLAPQRTPQHPQAPSRDSYKKTTLGPLKNYTTLLTAPTSQPP
jgi:hypothetical protein